MSWQELCLALRWKAIWDAKKLTISFLLLSFPLLLLLLLNAKCAYSNFSSSPSSLQFLFLLTPLYSVFSCQLPTPYLCSTKYRVRLLPSQVAAQITMGLALISP
ncbi:hypothetical protein V8C37DRAFT_368108 [Trichoderma ceciliae]